MSYYEDRIQENQRKFIRDVQKSPALQAELTQHFETAGYSSAFQLMRFAQNKGYDVGYEEDYLIEVLTREKMMLDISTRSPIYMEEPGPNLLQQWLNYRQKSVELGFFGDDEVFTMLYIDIPDKLVERALP